MPYETQMTNLATCQGNCHSCHNAIEPSDKAGGRRYSNTCGAARPLEADLEAADCYSSGLPLDLTAEAADRFPGAVELARTLEADGGSLEPIKKYLIHKQDVSEERANSEIRAYLKYQLLVNVTNENLAPSEDADNAWHAHILHTQHYGPWCQRHFRRFIHHVPSESGIHPSSAFLKKQNWLGRLFFGNHTIYVSKDGDCHNSHCGSHCGTQH